MATGLRDQLPTGCHLGVTQDGRVFFINDVQQTTSWLHPVTRQPVLTGLQFNPDLPAGWEQDITNEGRAFYVDHNRRLTTFDHPTYGPSDPVASSAPKLPITPQSPTVVHSKENFKRGESTQRSVKAPTAKRNPNAEIVKTGWLYRLESSGISKVWKRRWCVLADFALFVYKNEDETVTLTSILLPSYRINPCTEADNVKRNFVLKVEHENTKTLYFATDQQADCFSWMAHLRQAALMNGNTGFHREPNNNVKQFTMNKLPQDNGGPHFPASEGPPKHSREHNQTERPPSYDGGFNPLLKPGNSNTNQSSSYRGYSDPAGSPLATPTEPHFPSGYDNPIYSSHVSIQPPKQNFHIPSSANRGSFSDTPNRAQFQPPSSSRDNSFNTHQPHMSVNYPEHPTSFSVNPRTHPAGSQQFLKDGFASDSARNSLAHSDSIRSGHPYQRAPAETQHLQEQVGHPPDSYGQRPGSYGQHPDSYIQRPDSFVQRPDGYGQRPDSFVQRPDSYGQRPNSFVQRPDSYGHPPNSSGQHPDSYGHQQRDSYSDNNDNRVKHLNKWDQNFPAVQENHLIHGSIGDLLGGKNEKQPGNGSVFNARSKSHENFSQFPGMRHQPPNQQLSHGGQDQDHRPRSNMFQSQNLGGKFEQGPNRDSQNSHRPRVEIRPQESLTRSSASPQGSLSQHSPSYQPQRPLLLATLPRDNWGTLKDNRTPRLQSDYPQQHEASPASHSPGGSSGRDYGNHSLPPNSHFPPQHPSLDIQQHASLPRQKPVPPQRRTDLHLNFNANPPNPRTYQTQNSSHIYANLPSRNPQSSHSDSPNSSTTPFPARPPYPSAVRQQIVEEMAQTKAPSVQKDFLTSSQLNQQRMQQPPYFQYPSPRDPQSNQSSLERRSTTHQQPLQSRANPHLPVASHSGQPPWDDRRDGSQTSPESASHTNIMDPEAQKLLFAYERVHSLRMAPDKAAAKRQPALIQTVKEDPNMSDREVLETNLEKIARKNPLSGPRLRMSISANDLIGKTHDELVLLLIQLRRNQAGLGKARDVHRTRIEQKRPAEIEYRKQMHQYGKVQDRQLLDHHQTYMEVKGHIEEIESKLEVYKPIINLLGNMVTMGSLFGGDNLMLATQYRKHLLRPDQYQPPKKMLEFSRKQQEEQLVQKTEEEIKQLSSDEVDLEEKIDRLSELDHRLQEQSVRASSFKEDKELMEKALQGVLKQQDISRNDPREMERLAQQQRMLEKEISTVTQYLAEASKELEETTAQNSKLEYEVALLRNKVHGELTRSRSVPNLVSPNVQTKIKMEKELAKVEGLMEGLHKEGERLSQAMKTIRRSSSSSQLVSDLDKEGGKKKGGTYFETDLDSGEQVDLANSRGRAQTQGDNSTADHITNHQQQNTNSTEDWNVENADENTKRFFGLVPKEKPKTVTVRDVKRQAEQRKERDKVKRDDDEDYANGEEIKLQVSDVDNETSSIIHARVPTESVGQATLPGQWISGLPLYENLRYSITSNPEIHSAPGSRRSSLILMAPKPFTPYQDKTSRPFQSELELNASKEPQLNSTYFGRSIAKTPGTDSLNRNSENNSEILKSFHQDDRQTANNIPEQSSYVNGTLPATSGENNQYENGYYNNLFSSQNQISAGQFLVKPFSAHARSQSDISDKPSVDELFKPTDVRAILEQPAAGSNSWQSQDADPPASAFHITRPVNFLSYQPSRAYTAQPWLKPGADPPEDMFNVKRSPKGRYLTISSSEPLKLEKNTLFSQSLHSPAGDLILSRPIDNVPDIIKSSRTKMDKIDDKTIDREILYIPEKVLIPERYDPDADAEHLTQEDQLRRQEKAERIKRVLASQSVLSMSQTDISHLDSNVHSRIQQEQKERTHFLTLNQELARQVTLQSKKQAAERRKTWSGAQFADAKRQYEEQLLMYQA